MNQFFIFKIKESYLPVHIRDVKGNKYHFYARGSVKDNINNIYYIGVKEFRKLKIQNIEQNISEEDIF